MNNSVGDGDSYRPYLVGSRYDDSNYFITNSTFADNFGGGIIYCDECIIILIISSVLQYNTDSEDYGLNSLIGGYEIGSVIILASEFSHNSINRWYTNEDYLIDCTVFTDNSWRNSIASADSAACNQLLLIGEAAICRDCESKQCNDACLSMRLKSVKPA